MTESRDQRLDRSLTADPRPLIPYAHTPSLISANGLTGAGTDPVRTHRTTTPRTRTTTGRRAAAHRPRRLWRRLGAAALLTATLATGSALPAQAAAADAARTSGAAVSTQHATLTAPVELSRSTSSLPPRKGRG